MDNKIDLAIAWYHWSLFYVISSGLILFFSGTLRRLFLQAIAGCLIIISLAIRFSFLVRDYCWPLGEFRSPDWLSRVLPWSLPSSRTGGNDQQGAIGVEFL